MLEEQFHAMETWLMPMTHDGRRRDKEKVIGELTERFETMVKGYTKLIEVLKAKGHSPARPKPTRATPKRKKSEE